MRTFIGTFLVTFGLLMGGICLSASLEILNLPTLSKVVVASTLMAVLGLWLDARRWDRDD
jgi:hypothetical protein